MKTFTISIRRSNHRFAAVMAGVVMLSGSWIFAQDWPQWRGANRDGKVTGFTAPEKWPSALTQKWTAKVGSGDATPALVGDKLYVFTRQGANEVTLCLNAADGKELWQNKYEAAPVTGAASRHPGPRSSPAVADGKVVTLGVGGVLSCLDAASGTVVWRKDEYPKVVPKFFAAMSPLIADNLVIAQLGGKGNGAVMALDLASGDIKWKWANEGPEYASPVLLTVDGVKQIATLTEKSAVGIDLATGKLLWQLPFEPKGMAYNSATPVVEGQTVIFTGQGRGTKAIKIEKQGDAYVAKELWSNPQLATQFNTPVLRGGLLFGLSDKGNLFCINAKTGEAAWTDSVKRGGNFAAVVDAGSVILALPSNMELIAFKPTDKEFTAVAQIKVADTPTYATPVIAGNRVFIKDNENLTLWTL